MLTDISRLGFGGAGIPDVLPQAIEELQRKRLVVVNGTAAPVKMTVAEMQPEDTIAALVDLTTLVSVDVSTTTVGMWGFTSTLDLSGKRLLVCWYDKKDGVNFPNTPIIDTFNRPDEIPLVGGWIPSESGPELHLVSNQIASGTSSFGVSSWSTLFGSDWEIYFDVSVLPGQSDYPAFAIFAMAAEYVFEGYLQKFAGEWAFNLASQNNTVTKKLVIMAGDAVGLRRVGPTVDVFVRNVGNWTRLFTLVEPVGHVSMAFTLGIYDSARKMRLDNFGGGTIPR